MVRIQQGFELPKLQLYDYIGATFDMAEAYRCGNEDAQLFVVALADFLVAFLKENCELVEPVTPEFNEIQHSSCLRLHAYAMQLLLSLSTVDDMEIFKVYCFSD